MKKDQWLKNTLMNLCVAMLLPLGAFGNEEIALPSGYEPDAGLPDFVVRGIAPANMYEFGGGMEKDFEEKIKPQLPTEPIAKPAKPRKLLLHHNPRRLRHVSESLLRKMIIAMGEKTGAYETTLSNDFEALTKENLAKYDVLLISISIGYPTDKLSTVLDFVRNGGGLILIHSSATAFTEPEFFKVVGGKFTFHPFAGQELVYRNETPDHPLTAMFPAEFPFKDEVFHFKEPYSRDTMTVLLSVNYEKSVNAHPIVEKKKGEGKTSDLRDDHDYAVSWVRAEGKGRVFFTTLGHEMKTVMDPRFMRHILAAIQYGCGDIEPPNKK